MIVEPQTLVVRITFTGTIHAAESGSSDSQAAQRGYQGPFDVALVSHRLLTVFALRRIDLRVGRFAPTLQQFSADLQNTLSDQLLSIRQLSQCLRQRLRQLAKMMMTPFQLAQQTLLDEISGTRCTHGVSFQKAPVK